MTYDPNQIAQVPSGVPFDDGVALSGSSNPIGDILSSGFSEHAGFLGETLKVAGRSVDALLKLAL